MHEWAQSEHTHENGIVRSRIDRMYINQHVTHQLQKHCECVALPFPLGLSAHRPLSFSRRSPSDDRWVLANSPVPVAGIEHSMFPSRVEAIFNARMQDHRDPTEFETLEVLKVSIRFAAKELAQLAHNRDPNTVEEKLSAVFGFLRAAEQRNIKLQQKYAKRYIHIQRIVNPDSPHVISHASLQRLRDHAAELSKEELTVRIQELQHVRDSLPEYEYHAQKEHILTKLKKLIPGTCASLSVMHTPDGFSTDPNDLADILRTHWGEVFKKKVWTWANIGLGWVRILLTSRPSALALMIVAGV